MTLCLALLLALSNTTPGILLYAAEPAYPPNALTGGTAILAVSYADGAVKAVSLLSGEEPFSKLASKAVSQWRFDPNASGRTLVVVCFRRPELLTAASAVQEPGPQETVPGLPSAKVIVEPDYPPNGIAQGSVVLHLEVSRNGSLGRCEVIKDLGALTETSIAAVQKWRFGAARDIHGNDIDSDAYAVLVYCIPVLVPGQTRPR